MSFVKPKKKVCLEAFELSNTERYDLQENSNFQVPLKENKSESEEEEQIKAYCLQRIDDESNLKKEKKKQIQHALTILDQNEKNQNSFKSCVIRMFEKYVKKSFSVTTYEHIRKYFLKNKRRRDVPDILFFIEKNQQAGRFKQFLQEKYQNLKKKDPSPNQGYIKIFYKLLEGNQQIEEDYEKQNDEIYEEGQNKNNELLVEEEKTEYKNQLWQSIYQILNQFLINNQKQTDTIISQLDQIITTLRQLKI